MMQCNISCPSFRSEIYNGFSNLQQEQEFVDMTLAADGHLVKVHRNLIALSSPYLREMLHSAPCQHPVIFLSNVSHDILSLLLEYIYTGEVNVTKDKLNSLLEAAKTLHIKGFQEMLDSTVQEKNKNQNKENHTTVCNSTNIPAKKKCTQLNIYENKDRPAQNSNKGNVDLENNQKQTKTLGNRNFEDIINHQNNKPIITSNILIDPNNYISTSGDKDGNNQFAINSTSDWNENQNLARNTETEITETTVNNYYNQRKENVETENYRNLDFQSNQRDISYMDAENTVEANEITSERDLIIFQENFDSFGSKNTNFETLPITNIQIDLNQLNSTYQKDVSITTKNNGDTEIEHGNAGTSMDSSNINISCSNDIRDETYNIIQATSQSVTSTFDKSLVTTNITANNAPIISVDAPARCIHIDLAGSSTSQGQNKSATNLNENSPLFVMSKRGCLQMILHRYLYFCHYDAFSGKKRRWRCFDYRKLRCQAFIDTEGDSVVCRKFAHNHPFHDEKILKKGPKSTVYTSLSHILKKTKNVV